MVERLRERANVSYEEAKGALEATDWDLLDAIVKLEKEGKVEKASYSTKREQTEDERKSSHTADSGQAKGDGFERFTAFVTRVVKKGNANSFCVLRHGEERFRLPVTALVLLLIFTFYFILPLMVFCLFFGFHYRFVGPDLGKETINNAMNKAADVAEKAKEEVKKEWNKEREETDEADKKDDEKNED